MKNKKIIRKFTVLLAALVIMCGFSVTAYAGGGDESDDTPTPVTEETPAPETEPEETTGGYEPQPLTPDGNMSLVDDITGEASGDKQFITVVTKSGNYFYIIIDRAEDGENTVHFLNQVRIIRVDTDFHDIQYLSGRTRRNGERRIFHIYPEGGQGFLHECFFRIVDGDIEMPLHLFNVTHFNSQVLGNEQLGGTLHRLASMPRPGWQFLPAKRIDSDEPGRIGGIFELDK